MCKITAKYNGKCRKCGSFLRAGSLIEWSRTAGASCAGGCGGASSRTAALKPANRAGDCTGATVLRRIFDSKPDCASQIGQTWRVGPQGGSMAGQIVVCVGAARRYESESTNEDMGDMRGASWYLTLYVRAATEEQTAIVIAAEQVEAVKATAEAARQALLVELDALVRAAANELPESLALRPAGRVLTLCPGVHGSGVEVAVLADDGTVSIHWGGHYDDYRPSLWSVRSERAAEILRTLLG